jgi:signal transduction histidine kinase
MAAHLHAYKAGWTETTEYAGDDPRLPMSVHEFNHANGVDSLVVSPLALPGRNLGWVALSTARGPACELAWRRALVDAMARQATLALHHNRVADQNRLEERRKAVLEERNRIARDIHDTLAQGFAAILMQLQAAQRAAGQSLPAAVATSLDTAVELARTHMIEARRSVSALRPESGEQEDVGAALRRLTDMARRTSGLPVELTVHALPPFGAGVEREIIGIAQEALTNAVRHSRGRRITVHAEGLRAIGFRLAVADDGRGFAADKCGSGFGMTSMRERAERIGASLTIVTAPRGGTEVVLAWEPPSFSIPRPADVAR